MAVPWIQRLYVPAPGQPDVAARTAALSCAVSSSEFLENQVKNYPLPTVLLYVTNGRWEVLPEPTTLAAVDAVEAALALGNPPVSWSLGQHTGQTNPHGITPATIGASADDHTHPGGAPHNHDGSYATNVHAHAYAAESHSHVDGDLPGGLARDAEVAAAYSPIAHTHSGGATGGIIRKTANQTMTATSQAAITDMSFAVVSGGSYWFRMTIPVTTSTGTSPTTAYGFTGPTVTALGVTMKQPTSTSVDAAAVLTAFGNFAAGAQVANTLTEFDGVLTASANGTVQLTVARAGTNPSMVIPAGANGVWMRLA